MLFLKRRSACDPLVNRENSLSMGRSYKKNLISRRPSYMLYSVLNMITSISPIRDVLSG
jgi:hypothetical protein